MAGARGRSSAAGWSRLSGPTASRARFEKSAVPQAFCDLDGVLTEVNPAFGRLVGTPPEELAGRRLHDLCHRTDTGDADAYLARLLAGELEATQCERVLRGADGRPVPTLVDATLLRDEDGRPVGAAAMYQDLSLLHSLEHRRQRQEDFFLALAQRASDLAVVLDPEGRLVYASPALSTMLGHAPEDVLLTPAGRHVHPDDAAVGSRLLGRVLAEDGTGSATLRVRGAAGAWHWTEVTASNLLDTAVGGVVCNLRDVTDRVRAEDSLRASERRYRAIADNADEGLWVTAPDGRTTYVNQRMVDILGLPPEEVLGRPFLEVLDPTDRLLTRHRAAAARETHRSEVAYEHPDGGLRTLVVSSASLDDVDGACDGWLAMVSDVTEARRLERELRDAALRDTLTGLPNRALLLDRLEHALARESAATAVLLVDLDHFRGVNDAHGHAGGDDVLVAVAERLRAAVRPADTVGRFGGDEFLVVCEDVDEATARVLAQDVLDALRGGLPMGDGEVHVSASIGLALSPVTSAAELLRRAEAGLYAAKDDGRDRVRVFDAALAESAERFELGVALRRAIAADELRLDYQPVVDLRTGTVVGVEALARWEHPALGPLPPGRFVRAAEEAGLAAALDSWAVRRAVREAAALRESGAMPPDAYVAVNVSARSLADPALETAVTRAVEAARLSPADVVLEVTESAIMVDPAGAADLLGRLRQRGFGVALDDFGTGHSSLAYLRRLPVSMLKIDRSFVAELTADTSARAITASIIDLARVVGLTVVAEGVESRGHAGLLRRLGADVAQGWLWCPAVTPDEAARTGALTRTYDVGEASSP